jgi:phosphoglycerate-specific signal transduction histidine kinase
MNMKFGIGVVVAIVLQVSAFVWWTAQQAQIIQQLNEQVTELTSRMAVEESVNMIRDLEDIKKELNEHEEWIDDLYYTQDLLVEFATFTENRWADTYGTDNSYERKFGMKQPKEQ